MRASHLLPYHELLQSRAEEQITGIVIHCTETPDLQTARELGEQIHYPDSATGNSGHFYIDTDGRIEQYVPIGRIAHHVLGYNDVSIGIELVNRGRYPNWLHSQFQHMTTPYNAVQFQALRQLLASLQQQLPSLQWISGHEDLDQRLVKASDNPHIMVHRKMDPGVMFPWPEIMQAITLERFYP